MSVPSSAFPTGKRQRTFHQDGVGGGCHGSQEVENSRQQSAGVIAMKERAWVRTLTTSAVSIALMVSCLSVPASAEGSAPCPHRSATFLYDSETDSYTTSAKRFIRFRYSEEEGVERVTWRRQQQEVLIGKSWVTVLGTGGGTIIEPVGREQRSYSHDRSDGFYIRRSPRATGVCGPRSSDDRHSNAAAQAVISSTGA